MYIYCVLIIYEIMISDAIANTWMDYFSTTREQRL